MSTSAFGTVKADTSEAHKIVQERLIDLLGTENRRFVHPQHFSRMGSADLFVFFRHSCKPSQS